jgi:hypothetical protein
MVIDAGFILYLICAIILIAIVYYVGLWAIKLFQLGEPWPRILQLVIALLLITAIIGPLLGVGPFLRFHAGVAVQ